MWRETTGGIGLRGIAGEQKSLAAATAEIAFALRAVPARLRHPVSTTKTVKGIRGCPDPTQSMLPNAREPQCWDHPRRLAGQYLSTRLDRQEAASPPMHTGLGTL